jgi:thiamine kinase-like enzyme
MENNQNKVNLIKEELIKLISGELNYLYKLNEEDKTILNSEIDQFLNKFIKQNEIKMEYKKDKNITSNSIYLLYFKSIENGMEIKMNYMLKIRKELSCFKFDQELKYISKMNLLQVIPEQYMYFQLGERFTISIEEYISIGHLPESELIENFNSIIKSLSKIHTLDKIPLSNGKTIPDILDSEKQFFFHFIVHVLIPFSKSTIDEISKELIDSKNSSYKEYYEENKNVLERIETLINNSYTLVKKLISNFSSNKRVLVFCLNDLHLNNMFLKKDGNSVFIDFEDLSFSLVGFDVANCLMECNYMWDDEYPFFKYGHINQYDVLEELTKIFNFYIDSLNSISSDFNYEYLSLNDIYILICLSIIKSVLENVNMVNLELIVNRKSIDFLLLNEEKIKTFDKYYKFIFND